MTAGRRTSFRARNTVQRSPVPRRKASKLSFLLNAGEDRPALRSSSQSYFSNVRMLHAAYPDRLASDVCSRCTPSRSPHLHELSTELCIL